MIAIIDYDAGNLRSVEKAFLFLGQDVIVSSDPQVILGADKVVLPGVGAFGDAMDKLTHAGLDAVVKEVIKKGTPFLGICLGMQLMYEFSEEGNCEGLGILKGTVKRFSESDGLKIPQIGWNSLHVTNRNGLLKGCPEVPYVYFVHSYYVDAADKSSVSATVEYGACADVLVETNNIHLTQFHPEKSGEIGLQMLKNFALGDAV
ncbi:MAG: imidazole glycerol phosphate synthase subunit HisH [Ruminococcaceae bacterium]|nr:imidazole glycerol phosphate synthase subunit HisH [Oscillospiraceae bacterium]